MHDVISRSILASALTVGLQEDQINGPAWVLNKDLRSSDKYDILANVPPGTTQEMANVLMQNLLKERFKLAFHIEKRNLDAYQLVIARGGPKLKDAAEADGPVPPRPALGPGSGGFPLDHDGFPELPAGRSDIVATAQTGRVMVDPLAAARPIPVQRGGDVTGSDDPIPDLFAAIEKQLGLRLEKTKAPFDVLVVDHIEKTPTDN